jgi:putative ABC transport system permease protein
LTLLGIIIGVASVILVGAAIDGLGVYAEGITARAFGSDSYLVAQIASVGRLTRKQWAEKQRRNKRIRPDEVAYLRETTGDEIMYSPYEQRIEDVKAVAQKSAANQVYEGAIILGVSYTLPDMRDVPVASGRFFTETEERMRQPVAVIGEDIRAALFPAVSPLGQKIRLSGTEFTIIGLLEKQGSSFGRSMDNPVYMPTTVYGALYGTKRGGAVFGKARPGTNLSMEDALDTTRAALRSRFHARPGQEDNFDTLTPDSVRSFVGQILVFIAAIVVPVTSISLVVGGIVIMNIMLVSVTERTREIGIRKSLGARRADIMLQFLTESVILSLAGGFVGLALGALSSAVLSALFGATLKITLPYVFLAIFVSSAVGMISGWYPARRAARMDPVVALRASNADQRKRNSRDGARGGVGAQVPLRFDHPRYRDRHHNGSDSCIAFDGTAEGHRRFLSGVRSGQHLHSARERRSERQRGAYQGTPPQADSPRVC